MKKKFVYAASVILVGATIAVGCSREEDTPKPVPTPTPPPAPVVSVLDQNKALVDDIKENYADIVYASYEDSHTKAVELKTALDAFVATPDATTLQAAKDAWLESREPYGETEVYRFGQGPIDGIINGVEGPEGLLNSWPCDENYMDYVGSNATAGIINDIANFPTIDKATLEAENGNGGEANVSIGYHAIEFLLWGQDLSTTGPGARPHTDYLTTGGTSVNQGRRGEYLKVCGELLVDHLQLMLDAWKTGGGNYRADFIALNNDEALTRMLTGMGELSGAELATERMFVALDTHGQEDEHSCFSDNTHRDIFLNAKGIVNVFNGSYTRIDGSIVSGSSIKDLIAIVDPTIAGQLTAYTLSTMVNVTAIPVPFDQEILTQNTSGGTIITAITDLRAQGDKIVEMGSKFGLTITY